jgi:hypothetical protein
MRCNLDYKDIGKEKYQIEVSVDAIKRRKEGVPKEWTLMSQTKTVKRFHTPTVTSLLKPLAEAEYTADVYVLSFSPPLVAEYLPTPLLPHPIICLGS